MEWHLNNDQCLKPASAERERERLDASISELDRECSINDWFRLPDQLVKPVFARGSIAALVHVNAVSDARRLAVDGHAERNCAA